MQSFPLTKRPSWALVGGYLVTTELVDFDVMSELLGISYPLTWATRLYFGLIDEPQIRMECLRMNIPWGVDTTKMGVST